MCAGLGVPGVHGTWVREGGRRENEEKLRYSGGNDGFSKSIPRR